MSSFLRQSFELDLFRLVAESVWVGAIVLILLAWLPPDLYTGSSRVGWLTRVGLMLFAAVAFQTARVAVEHRLDRRRIRYFDPQRCPYCGYDVRGVDDTRCPECGGRQCLADRSSPSDVNT